MSKFKDDRKLQEIIQKIREGKQKGVSSSEILEDLTQLMPIKVVEVPKPFKTSEKRRKKQAEYREKMTILKQCKSEDERYNLTKQIKLSNAKEIDSMVCFNCKKRIQVDPRKNTLVYRDVSKSNKKKIIAVNICPICGKNVKIFRGFFVFRPGDLENARS